MKYLKTLLAAVICLTSAFAADFSGTWKGMMPTREGGSFPVVLALKSEGETLTGTMASGTGAAHAFDEGKVMGEQIQFSTTATLASGEKRKTVFTGRMDGSQLKISAVRDGNPRPLEMTLDRQ